MEKETKEPDFPTMAFNLGRASGPLEEFKQSYFVFDQEQLEKYQKFVDEQLATGTVHYGFCGGNFSITFCPTGVGLIVTAKCSNGKEIELSEGCL